MASNFIQLPVQGGASALTLTGDVTGSGTSSISTTIAANVVTNAKAAQMATLTLKGNNTGSTANALDLTVSQVQTMLSIPAPSGGIDGQMQRLIGGVATWADQIYPSLICSMYQDFIGEANSLNSNASGGGGVSGIRSSASAAGHPGGWRLDTGVNTNGFGNAYSSNIDDLILLGGGTAVFETSLRLSALSTGGQTYAVAIGLAKGPYNDVLPASDGIYFYGDSNANANWRLRTQAATVVTDRDTGVPITAGANSWIKLGWILNSAGTSVQAYINGAAAGAPITTNIPTAAVQYQSMIQKAAGTTEAICDIDYFKFMITLATPR